MVHTSPFGVKHCCCCCFHTLFHAKCLATKREILISMEAVPVHCLPTPGTPTDGVPQKVRKMRLKTVRLLLRQVRELIGVMSRFPRAKLRVGEELQTKASTVHTSPFSETGE